MEVKIKIKDLECSELKDLDTSLMLAVFGGKPTTETSLAYDIAWAVTAFGIGLYEAGKQACEAIADALSR